MIFSDVNSLIMVFIYGVFASAISFLTVYFVMPKAITSLREKGSIVQDYHKPERPTIPRPAGPILIIGITISLIVVYLLTFNEKSLAILLTTIIAFLVGYIDDRKVLPGWFKPVALVISALPILILGAYDTNLNLIFGNAFIPLLYIPLILIAIPVIGNTINSIDVLNGVASGFILIACIPLMISVYIFGSVEVFLASLSLFFGTIALYKFHKFPSKIFPGDSGTLLLGAMYGAIAITGKSELIAIIALLPAIFNSFLFLSSVKKIVEHRKITARPTFLTDDFKLAASKDKKAPITLLRLLLVDGPLSENELVNKIFKLAIFSSILALISIVIQYYFVMGGRI
ncbi:MAG TPA: UDP-N-acetylglucosamine-1-phosphate transferase [Nitrososphaeraceae archaeon]|nr:UDP-N-acetylglucosamine-1-phosphate transferase [Nitrososphaeraceae archaeon]